MGDGVKAFAANFDFGDHDLKQVGEFAEPRARESEGFLVGACFAKASGTVERGERLDEAKGDVHREHGTVYEFEGGESAEVKEGFRSELGCWRAVSQAEGHQMPCGCGPIAEKDVFGCGTWVRFAEVYLEEPQRRYLIRV